MNHSSACAVSFFFSSSLSDKPGLFAIQKILIGHRIFVIWIERQRLVEIRQAFIDQLSLFFCAEEDCSYRRR